MFPTRSLPDQRRATLRAAGFAATLLLAVALPFELERPLLPLGPLVLTTVEVLLAAVLALALVAGPVTSLSLIHI